MQFSVSLIFLSAVNFISFNSLVRLEFAFIGISPTAEPIPIRSIKTIKYKRWESLWHLEKQTTTATIVTPRKRAFGETLEGRFLSLFLQAIVRGQLGILTAILTCLTSAIY